MFRRIAPLAALAILSSLLLVVPALGNSPDDAVRLHIGSDSQTFTYAETTQPITTIKNNNCEIKTTSQPLIALTGTSGGSSAPAGISALSVGVKSNGSNSNGTPCSQVDATESLSLTANTATGSPLANRSFNKVRLDLEMTGDALVRLDFYSGSTLQATAWLQTGNSITAGQVAEADFDREAPYVVSTLSTSEPDLTDACAAPNSSGPNSGGNDNCLWTVDPGKTFNKITLRSNPGTVSLEGSSDFGNDPDHDSLFYLANAIPAAVNDSYSTNEDIPLSVSATNGVLKNDTDADHDGLTASLVTGVAHGTLKLAIDGSFLYTPSANYNGSDSFTYRASDGTASSNLATVTINVAPVNDPPEGIVGSASTSEDTSTTITVATDVDSTDLTADCETTEGGAWTNNGDGSVDYTPPENFNGTDVLTCTVTDDQGESTTTEAEITITVGAVNDPPVAYDDEAYTNGSTPVQVFVLANDTDVDTNNPVDPDVLEVSSVDTSGSLGTVTIASDAKSVTYTPPTDFTGSDSFMYTVSDGNGGSDTATVTVYELFQCGETLTVSEGGTSAEYTRLPPGEGGCGDGKPYTVEIIKTDDATTTSTTEQLPTVVFQPRSQTDDPVYDCSVTPGDCLDEFAAKITFGPRPELNAPDTGTLHYDPVNRAPEDYNTSTTFRTMKWCEIDPFASETRPPSDAILPTGESWCIVSVTTTINSSSETLTTWSLYGIGDPAKRL